MTKNNKKYFLVLFLLVIFLLPAGVVESAASITITATPSDTGFDTDATPTYCMGGLVNMESADYWVLKFPSGFDLTGLTISDTDTASELELHVGTLDCDATGVSKRIVEDSTSDDQADRDPAEVDGQNLYIYLNDVYWDGIGVGNVSFYFIDKTDAGNTQAIKNPSSAANYSMIFAQGPQGAGPKEEWTYDAGAHIAQLIYIGGLNEVDISAAVDPTLTLAIVEKDSDTPVTTCALGTFSTTDIKTCVYRTKVITNATSGYTAYMISDGDLRTSGGDTINAESGDDSVSEGSEEYGVSVSSASSGFVRIDDETTTGDLLGTPDSAYDYWDCDYIGADNDVDPVALAAISSSTDTSLGSLAASTDGDYITVCHGASIAGTTAAGSYTQTITITVVGNF